MPRLIRKYILSACDVTVAFVLPGFFLLWLPPVSSQDSGALMIQEVLDAQLLISMTTGIRIFTTSSAVSIPTISFATRYF